MFSNTNNNGRRRIQPVSAPRRPPDIQNMTLFPPIDDSSVSTSMDNCVIQNSAASFTFSSIKDHEEGFSTSSIPLKTNNSGSFLSANEKLRFKRLENKLQGRKQEINSDSNNGFGSINDTIINGQQDRLNDTPTTIIPIKKRQCPRSAEFFSEINPEIGTRITQLASNYSSLLDQNMNSNPNILEEICLLLQLITSSRPSDHLDVMPSLSTLAQQVFFVIKVLTLQLNTSLLSIDPEVIQLLVEKYPHRIPKPFRKNFSAWISTQLSKVKERSPNNNNNANNGEEDDDEPSRKPSEFHRCVTFRSETDGRSNFPSQGNFHAFCKQRDLFYSIKSAWEEGNSIGNSIAAPTNNGVQDHNNVSSFGKQGSSLTTQYTPKYAKNGRDTITATDPIQIKIKALFNLNSTWVNLSHFAALFSEQFIMDSMEESRKKTRIVGGDEVMKVLQLSSKSNPDRLTKLSNRMSSTSSGSSESESKSKDSFTFLQYFITTAASPAFNQHLVDRICYEIRQIEESLDSAETGNISLDEEQFLIKKTILLSKVLGYVWFLPYRENPQQSDNIRPNNNNNNNAIPTLDSETLYSKHIELRKHQTPPIIELCSFLRNAAVRSRLTFTMPWIIELLSAADYISLRLPSYKEILLRICSIYKSLCSVVDAPSKSTTTSNLCLANKNFLRFWCGHLFSLQVFPVSLLYNNNYTETNEFVVNFKQSLSLSTTPSTTTTTDDETDREDSEIHMDEKAILGEQLSRFYFSSNFNQMKFILHSGLQQQQHMDIGNNSSATTITRRQHRHIRPIPAAESNSTITALKTRVEVSLETELQRQLEHSFFDGHSPSVKRTVDFVSDRIASNYVKILRKIMIEQRGELAKKRIFEQAAAESCRKAMLEGVVNFIGTKCQVSLTLLLGETSLSLDAVQVCQQIAERQTVDKVSQWVHTHIKAEMFPEIPLPDQVSDDEGSKSDVKNKTVPTPLSPPNQPAIVEDGPSFSFMISMHRCMKRLYEKKPVSESVIDDILNCSGLGQIPGLISTLIDFGVTLIACSPLILNATRQTKLVELWKPCWNKDCQLLSPRNILILTSTSNDASSSSNSQSSWTRLEQIISLLIKEKLLDFETVERDCFRLLRQDLSHQESKIISQLLKNILQQQSNTNDDDYGRSREVVDWISWYCSENQDGEF